MTTPNADFFKPEDFAADANGSMLKADFMRNVAETANHLLKERGVRVNRFMAIGDRWSGWEQKNALNSIHAEQEAIIINIEDVPPLTQESKDTAEELLKERWEADVLPEHFDERAKALLDNDKDSSLNGNNDDKISSSWDSN